MNMEQQKKSRWPFRILIVSLVCFVLGSVLLLTEMDTVDDILDPRNNNIAVISTETDQQTLIEIDDAGCYVLLGLDSMVT